MSPQALLEAVYGILQWRFRWLVLREKLLVFALSEGLTAGYLTVVVSAVVSNKIDLADSQ